MTDVLCTCTHWDTDHERGIGWCKGIDSYGLPCTCPSIEEDSDDATDPVRFGDDVVVVLVTPDGTTTEQYRGVIQRRLRGLT